MENGTTIIYGNNLRFSFSELQQISSVMDVIYLICDRQFLKSKIKINYCGF